MNQLQRCKPLLGTYVEISLQAELEYEELLRLSNKAFEEISKVHSSMSFHDANSELSKLNKAQELSLSSPMLKVFTFINQLYSDSQGLFDPTIAPALIKSGMLPPDQSRHISEFTGRWKDVEFNGNKVIFNKPLLIDLGGVAKGFAVDNAIEVFPDNVKATVNAGGDLRMTHWQHEPVEIVFNKGDVLKTYTTEMQSNAIASSASYYNNKSVVINPSNFESVDSAMTYSVYAPKCMTADALTKVAWLSEHLTSINLNGLFHQYDAQCLINHD